MKQISIFILSILLYSCASKQGYVSNNRGRTLNEAILDEINLTLDEGDLFKAYQLISYYEDQTADSGYLLEAKDRLSSLFPEKLRSNYDEKEWREFFVAYKNLEILGYDLSEYNIDEIKYNYIVETTPNKTYKAGVLLGENILDYSKLEKSQLQKLKEIYSNVSPESDYPELKKEFESRNYDWNIAEDSSNYIDGVVTVFVNKGITFKNGVGTSDIMVGSGFFIDKKGHVVTNHHVIESVVDPEYEGISHLYITLKDSVDKIPAKVVGWDKVLDLALLKVSSIPSYVYSFSSINTIDVGEKVVALGSPGGLGSTVTSGIVSAKDRNLLQLGSVIQIDSPINPGNSGGPLIDDNKRVTNVVFAGIEEFEGVNFAIPVKYLKKNLTSLYQGEDVKHVWLGAGLSYRKKKLEVIYIKPDSPAYYLGLEKGDIVESINGRKFEKISEIQDFLMDFEPYEIIEFEYSRDKKNFKKMVSLEERPKIPMESIIEGDTSDHLYVPLFGMDIQFTGKVFWNKEYKISDVYPGTIADQLELLPGDIIEVKKWEYNEEYEVVILFFIVQSQKEGFWEKPIQVVAPISVNFFI